MHVAYAAVNTIAALQVRTFHSKNMPPYGCFCNVLIGGGGGGRGGVLQICIYIFI